MDTENKGGNITDTFFNKLKEQSFTIILLVGILYYQNVNFKSQLEEYKKMIDEKETLILKLTEDEQINLCLKFNEFIEKKREETWSLFLPQFRESKEYARKRIPFELVYNIILHLQTLN